MQINNELSTQEITKLKSQYCYLVDKVTQIAANDLFRPLLEITTQFFDTFEEAKAHGLAELKAKIIEIETEIATLEKQKETTL